MAGDFENRSIQTFLNGTQTSARRLKSNIDAIIEKYNRPFEHDDEINLSTLSINKNRGVLSKSKRIYTFGTSQLKSTKRKDELCKNQISQLQSSIDLNLSRAIKRDYVSYIKSSNNKEDEISDAETLSSDSSCDDDGEFVNESIDDKDQSLLESVTESQISEASKDETDVESECSSGKDDCEIPDSQTFNKEAYPFCNTSIISSRSNIAFVSIQSPKPKIFERSEKNKIIINSDEKRTSSQKLQMVRSPKKTWAKGSLDVNSFSVSFSSVEEDDSQEDLLQKCSFILDSSSVSSQEQNRGLFSASKQFSVSFSDGAAPTNKLGDTSLSSPLNKLYIDSRSLSSNVKSSQQPSLTPRHSGSKNFETTLQQRTDGHKQNCVKRCLDEENLATVQKDSHNKFDSSIKTISNVPHNGPQSHAFDQKKWVSTSSPSNKIMSPPYGRLKRKASGSLTSGYFTEESASPHRLQASYNQSFENNALAGTTFIQPTISKTIASCHLINHNHSKETATQRHCKSLNFLPISQNRPENVSVAITHTVGQKDDENTSYSLMYTNSAPDKGDLNRKFAVAKRKLHQVSQVSSPVGNQTTSLTDPALLSVTDNQQNWHHAHVFREDLRKSTSFQTRDQRVSEWVQTVSNSANAGTNIQYPSCPPKLEQKYLVNLPSCCCRHLCSTPCNQNVDMIHMGQSRMHICCHHPIQQIFHPTPSLQPVSFCADARSVQCTSCHYQSLCSTTQKEQFERSIDIQGTHFDEGNKPQGMQFDKINKLQGIQFDEGNKPQGTQFDGRNKPQGTQFDGRNKPQRTLFNEINKPQGAQFDKRYKPQGTQFDKRNKHEGTQFDERYKPQGTQFDERNKPQGTQFDDRNIPQGPQLDERNKSQGPQLDERNKPQGPQLDERNKSQGTQFDGHRLSDWSEFESSVVNLPVQDTMSKERRIAKTLPQKDFRPHSFVDESQGRRVCAVWKDIQAELSDLDIEDEEEENASMDNNNDKAVSDSLSSIIQSEYNSGMVGGAIDSTFNTIPRISSFLRDGLDKVVAGESASRSFVEAHSPMPRVITFFSPKPKNEPPKIMFPQFYVEQFSPLNPRRIDCDSSTVAYDSSCQELRSKTQHKKHAHSRYCGISKKPPLFPENHLSNSTFHSPQSKLQNIIGQSPCPVDFSESHNLNNSNRNQGFCCKPDNAAGNHPLYSSFENQRSKERNAIGKCLHSVDISSTHNSNNSIRSQRQSCQSGNQNLFNTQKECKDNCAMYKDKFDAVSQKVPGHRASTPIRTGLKLPECFFDDTMSTIRASNGNDGNSRPNDTFCTINSPIKNYAQRKPYPVSNIRGPDKNIAWLSGTVSYNTGPNNTQGMLYDTLSTRPDINDTQNRLNSLVSSKADKNDFYKRPYNMKTTLRSLNKSKDHKSKSNTISTINSPERNSTNKLSSCQISPITRPARNEDYGKLNNTIKILERNNVDETWFNTVSAPDKNYTQEIVSETYSVNRLTDDTFTQDTDSSEEIDLL